MALGDLRQRVTALDLDVLGGALGPLLRNGGFRAARGLRRGGAAGRGWGAGLRRARLRRAGFLLGLLLHTGIGTRLGPLAGLAVLLGQVRLLATVRPSTRTLGGQHP